MITSEGLYALLPAVYRIRDAEQGYPLQALFEIFAREGKIVEDDIRRLYDNWFIETCDEWVVPYIGDLLGVRPIRPIESAGVSARAYVANTIAYRRRLIDSPSYTLNHEEVLKALEGSFGSFDSGTL